MKTIPGDRLTKLVGERLNIQPFLSDQDNAVSTLPWLLDASLPAFHKFLGQLSVLGYDQECWDCDDFALAFMFFNRMLHARTQSGLLGKKCGIAVGQMWFKRASGGGHAVNVAIVDDERLVLIEPQPTQNPLLTLTLEEEQSCEFCQF